MECNIRAKETSYQHRKCREVRGGHFVRLFTRNEPRSIRLSRY